MKPLHYVPAAFAVSAFFTAPVFADGEKHPLPPGIKQFEVDGKVYKVPAAATHWTARTHFHIPGKSRVVPGVTYARVPADAKTFRGVKVPPTATHAYTEIVYSGANLTPPTTTPPATPPGSSPGASGLLPGGGVPAPPSAPPIDIPPPPMTPPSGGGGIGGPPSSPPGFGEPGTPPASPPGFGDPGTPPSSPPGFGNPPGATPPSSGPGTGLPPGVTPPSFPGDPTPPTTPPGATPPGATPPGATPPGTLPPTTPTPPSVTPPSGPTPPSDDAFTPPPGVTPPGGFTPPGTQPTPPGGFTPPGTQPTPPGGFTPPGTQPTPPGGFTPPGTQPTPPGTQPTPPGTTPPSTGPEPGSQLKFVQLNQQQNRNGLNNPILTDIVSHLPTSYGNTYYDKDPITWGHETTHGINSHIRNTMNNTGGKANGFYLLNNRAVVLVEPRMRKSAVGPFIPRSLRGSRYGTYVTGSSSWDDTPLYLFDEWVAYINGGEVGVDMVKKGQWNRGARDGVAGQLEFTVYAIAVGMAAERHDANYFRTNTQFREFLAYNAKRAMQVFHAGYQLQPFQGFNQAQYLQTLRTSADAATMRAWIVRVYGAKFAREVFGI